MKAGFGKFDITPRVGVELCGFGPYQNRKSVGIRDILEARAGAFTAGGHTAVIITCDLAKVEADIVAVIRSLLCARYPELQEKDIMIQVSHTHSGPSVNANVRHQHNGTSCRLSQQAASLAHRRSDGIKNRHRRTVLKKVAALFAVLTAQPRKRNKSRARFTSDP